MNCCLWRAWLGLPLWLDLPHQGQKQLPYVLAEVVFLSRLEGWQGGRTLATALGGLRGRGGLCGISGHGLALHLLRPGPSSRVR
jgi:hypothetical protein